MPISDIKLVNSPCWTLTFNNCDDIKISGITVDNDIRTPHSDGVMDNVRISGLSAQSENIGVAAGNVTGLSVHDSNIQIVDSDKRKFASSFDIAPNGKLCAGNDFSGTFYAEQGIEVNIN